MTNQSGTGSGNLSNSEKYRPLPDNLTIKESNIQGLGLFALGIIGKGTNLGVSHVRNTEFQHDLIRTPLGGFINHSEEPNCETIPIGNNVYLITLKDILPDEELTLRYKLYKPY